MKLPRYLAIRASRPLLILVCGLFTATEPALALRLPVGAVASQKGYVSPDSYNISYVPWLLDLAKAVSKFPISPDYYLQNDPFSNYPGIDLRSLLYSQSSPLSILTELSTPARIITPESKAGPRIAVPSMKDNTPPTQAQHIQGYPQLSMSPLSPAPKPVNLLKARIGPLANVSIEGLHNPLQLAGFPGLSATLANRKSPSFQTTAFEPPKVHPLSSGEPPTSQASPISKMFMLWTVRLATAGPTITAGSKELLLPESPERDIGCQGTFVACMQGVHFQSIHGRKFTFDMGRLLASNKGDEMVFDTSVGNIHMNADTAAIIDLNGRQVLRVLALHSPKTNKITVVLKNSLEQLESVSLVTGEELIVSNHNLSAEEIKGSDGFERSQISLNGKLARAKVSLAQVLEKERLINPRVSSLTNPQRFALVHLRENISE